MRVGGLVRPQLFQDLVDNLGFFNACDYFHLAAALFTLLNIINSEDSLQPLRPGLVVATRFVRVLTFSFHWHHFTPVVCCWADGRPATTSLTQGEGARRNPISLPNREYKHWAFLITVLVLYRIVISSMCKHPFSPLD